MRRRDFLIYAMALGLSLVVHVGTCTGLGRAARNAPVDRDRVLEFEVVHHDPPPPPPPPAEEKPKPKPKPPPPKMVDFTKTPPPVVPPPPNQSEPQPKAEPVRPVFGVTMRSTVGPGTGSGFSVRVGNTLMKAPDKDFVSPDEVKPYNPVPLHQVTKMPRLKGECRADYPPQAKQLRIEGQVKLEIEVHPDGAVGEVRVVKGLGYGLDETAVEALKRCRFVPAEVDGQAVPTRIPYTFTFVIED
jgi:periplasmic protein TonB